MNRFYRLLAPAATFASVGTLILFLAPQPGFRLYGGLATAGLYALLVQLVLTLLLLVGIDDLRGGRRMWSGALLEAADPVYGLRRALTHFYLRRFTPAFLLAFGLAESTTTLAIGLLDRPGAPAGNFELVGVEVQRSALLVSFLLLAIAVLLFRWSVLACYGWYIGFAGGAALTEVVLASQGQTSTTLILWLAALLCVVRSVAPLLRALRAAVDRRRTALPARHADMSERGGAAAR